MAGPIRIAILANGRQARAEASLTARAYGGLGKSLGRLGAAAGLTALTAKAVGFTAASIKLEATYSQTMATIKSATGASSREMSKLNELALKLGKDTSFSATDASDAMLELAKAGVTTRNIMQGGVAGTLQLAAAGGTELATAATIASNAMNAFNIGGRKMGSIAAALAGAANASSASVESLGLGLSQVGPGAVNAGLSLQETVAALAAFDNAGIKGSDAGTSLKTMLARLVPQTERANNAMVDLGLNFVKNNGDFKSLANISEQLRRRLSKLSEARRVDALNAIFGSDASRAATVLMREGADGIRKYTKAAQDQGAAQKMAAARMSGTAGATERLSGAIETAQLRLGQELAPTVQKVADVLAGKAVPAMEGTIDAGKTLAHALEPVGKGLLLVGEGAAKAVQFVNGLPGPVKEIGVQAGLAALVLPRLSAGVTSVTSSLTLNIARLQQWRAEMTYAATRAGATATVMTRLGSAARSAAGIGGMVALTQASGRTADSMATLETAAGGALLGFSLGGPIGAAIGAGAGALYGLSRAADASQAAFRASLRFQEGYTESLSRTTAAIQKQTREIVYRNLVNNDALTVSRALGISDRDMVAAVTGQSAAIRRVSAVVRDHTGTMKQLRGANSQAFYFNKQSAADFLNGLRVMGGELNKDQRALLKQIAATKSWNQALKGLPRGVKVALRNDNYKVTIGQIQTLARQYKLNPKQLVTRLKLADVDIVKKQARDGGRGVAENLKTTTQKARADLTPLQRRLAADLSATGGQARAGGSSIGNSLGQGILAGVDPWAGPIASRAAAIVSNAVAAAKRAGKIHSPSQVMRDEVGGMLGEGLAQGLAGKSGRVAKEADRLTASVIAGAVRGTQGLSSALDRIDRLIENRLDKQLHARQKSIKKHLKGKAEEHALKVLSRSWAAHSRAVTKSLHGQRAALTANAKAQDALSAGNYLPYLSKASNLYKRMTKAGVHNITEARQAIADLRQQSADYATSVHDMIVSAGSLGSLGQDTGFGSIDQLIAKRTTSVEKAEKFAAMLEQLRGKLNPTDIQELISLGVEGGFGTAQAILNGGPAAISKLNSLAARLNNTGLSLGSDVSKTLYGAGIQAAQGLLDGLEAKAANLDRAATRLARALVRAVKKALGIKSPSRVFRGIGDNIAVGLVQGIDARNTYVRRSAAGMASQVVSGFGTPALKALDSVPSVAATPAPVQIVVQVPPTADKAGIGRELASALDAYYNAGGRRPA